MRDWLYRRLLKGLARLRGNGRVHQPKGGVKPRVEQLEERWVPATFEIDPAAGGATAALRGAISTAQNNGEPDTINILAGTIDLTQDGGGDLDVTIADGEQLTIAGAGADATAIDAKQADRVLDVGSSSNGLLVFDGVTLQNGKLPGGAGYAGLGGGILTRGSADLTLRNSVVTGNTINGRGGAFYHFNGTLTIQSCTISNNSSTGSNSGGAGYLNGTVVIEDSTITGNSTELNGAALQLPYGHITTTIRNCTFYDNSATGKGGAIRIRAGVANVYNSTIAGNTAGSYGGGILVESGTTVNLYSTIVAGNNGSGSHDEISNSGTVNADDCLIQGATSGTISQTGTTATLLGQDPLLDSTGLQDNGGPTQTLALQTGSSAINQGNNDQGFANDQRGTGFARHSGAATDVGAYELDLEPPTSTLDNAPDVGPALPDDVYDVTVTHTAATLLDVSTIDVNDLSISGPGGTLTNTSVVSITPNSNAASIQVVYRFTPPGGTWDIADNGTYTISIGAGDIANIDGTPNDAEQVGTFRVDFTGPSFRNSTPSTDPELTTIDLDVALDEAGTAYCVVLADGAAAPTATEVKAGTGSGGSAALQSATVDILAADTTYTETITGLNPDTAYDLYVVAEDVLTNLQDLPTLCNVTTDESPILDPSFSPTLTAIHERGGDPAGDSVADIVVDGSITNVPSGSAERIVVTEVDNTNGVWQYSLDAGGTWNDFTATVGESVDISSSTPVLGPTDRVRFLPDADLDSGTESFVFRVWSYVDATPDGTVIDISSQGSPFPYSAAQDTATIVVDYPPTFRNDTPSVVWGEGSIELSVALDEAGTAYYVVLADGAAAPDSAQVKAGNDGTGSAALKSGTIDVPDADTTYSETITGLDSQTNYDVYVVAEDGSTPPNLQGEPTSLNGDAPTPILDPSYSPTLSAINEQQTDPAGNSVADIIVDGSITNLPSGQPERIVVTSVDNTNGTWQYSLDAGATWSDFTPTQGQNVDISSSARVLGAEDYIRFVPDVALSSGTANFVFRAWSCADATPDGSAVDINNQDDPSPFSAEQDTASITVNDVDDLGLTITAVDDQTATGNGPVGPGSFTVSNPNGPDVGMLILSGSSSNPAIVPNANITFDGYAGDRTVTVTPAANVPGTTTITITADNGLTRTSTSFEVIVLPSFDLTGPTSGIYFTGEIVPIQWTAEAVNPGSKISLCYDEDTTWWNGNEHWIEVDQVDAANGDGSYNWDTTGVTPGTYYIAGYMYDFADSSTFSHLTESIQIQIAPQTFVLTGPTSGTYAAGEDVSIEWTAGGVVAGAKISLCYDEDTTWWNGNEHWIEVDQVDAANGSHSYNWDTTGVAPGTYYIAGYMYDFADTSTFWHLSESVRIQPASQTFDLTAPTSGAYAAGEVVSIDWTAGGVVAGAKISLCYDEDTTWWNGNEHWIEVDQVDAADGAGSYNWDTTGVAPGTYCIAGYMYDFVDTFTFSHLNDAIQIQGFSLTGPTSGIFSAGESVSIEWTASGVVPGSKISLCYDEDTTWWNGNEHWIEVDQVDAANGAGSYNWDTTGVAPGTYYIAGYMYDFVDTFSYSHLKDAIQIQSQCFSLTGPTSGTFTVGDSVTIEWAASGVISGSKISLCYDEDTTWWNDNEHWIEVDQVDAVNGTDSYSWDTTGVTPGTYYIAGYMYDFVDTFTQSHLNDAIVIGSALLLDGEEIPGTAIAGLTEADLEPIACKAIADWAEAAIDAGAASTSVSTEGGAGSGTSLFAADYLDKLAGVSFVIADLAGTQLALAAGDTIYVDINAAGHGWFIDSTPASDEEFQIVDNELHALDPQAVDRVDLLTVLYHELGHILGFEDLDPSADTVMSGQLAPGLRRTLAPVEVDGLWCPS